MWVRVLIELQFKTIRQVSFQNINNNDFFIYYFFKTLVECSTFQINLVNEMGPGAFVLVSRHETASHLQISKRVLPMRSHHRCVIEQSL